jgi:hypothetical protein
MKGPACAQNCHVPTVCTRALMFVCPCIVSIIRNWRPTRCNFWFIYLYPISSTCFGQSYRPSSGALDCIYSFWCNPPMLLPPGVTDEMELSSISSVTPKSFVSRSEPECVPLRTIRGAEKMRFTCWITKATDTHSEYVILIAFPRQKWLNERASVLRYTTLTVLLCPCVRRTSTSAF